LRSGRDSAVDPMIVATDDAQVAVEASSQGVVAVAAL
jgi:hypothetical protein